jgi:DNA-binding PadR family transcriptional regulator
MQQRPPKGLLTFYILHLISESSTHGFEILQSIEEKIGGSWRLGAGSIYPTLRKLTEEGLISTNSKPRSSSQSSQRIYQITPKGVEFLREGKDVLANADRNWYAMRGIFIDLMDAAHLPTFLGEVSKANFQLSREIIEAKVSKLTRKEAELALKEYALSLKKQLTWTETKMQKLELTKRQQQRGAEVAVA